MVIPHEIQVELAQPNRLEKAEWNHLVNQLQLLTPRAVAVTSEHGPEMHRRRVRFRFQNHERFATEEVAQALVPVKGSDAGYAFHKLPLVSRRAGLVNPADLRILQTSNHGTVLAGRWISSEGWKEAGLLYRLACDGAHYIHPAVSDPLEALKQLNCRAFELKAEKIDL